MAGSNMARKMGSHRRRRSPRRALFPPEGTTSSPPGHSAMQSALLSTASPMAHDGGRQCALFWGKASGRLSGTGEVTRGGDRSHHRGGGRSHLSSRRTYSFVNSRDRYGNASLCSWVIWPAVVAGSCQPLPATNLDTGSSLDHEGASEGTHTHTHCSCL